jgi:hypothetical protein
MNINFEKLLIGMMLFGFLSFISYGLFVLHPKNNKQLKYLESVCNGAIITEPHNSQYFAVCIQQDGSIVWPMGDQNNVK